MSLTETIMQAKAHRAKVKQAPNQSSMTDFHYNPLFTNPFANQNIKFIIRKPLESTNSDIRCEMNHRWVQWYSFSWHPSFMFFWA